MMSAASVTLQIAPEPLRSEKNTEPQNQESAKIRRDIVLSVPLEFGPLTWHLSLMVLSLYLQSHVHCCMHRLITWTHTFLNATNSTLWTDSKTVSRHSRVSGSCACDAAPTVHVLFAYHEARIVLFFRFFFVFFRFFFLGSVWRGIKSSKLDCFSQRF